MKFLWPPMLWLLAVVPALIGVYVLLLRRRRRALARFASLRMVNEALQDARLWRRHVPAVFFFTGITMMLLAAARPEATVSLPLQEETVILAIDVSGSMRATDVYPDRLSVAQVAAKQFVRAKSPTTRVGIVEFAGTAVLVQVPTAEHERLLEAIDALQVRDATAIGGAILTALKAIFPKMELNRMPAARPASIDQSTAIILLTDGENTAGPEPLQAATLAAQHGVRVYTVGLGTDHGDVVPSGHQLERVRLDESSLRQIADMTGGEYFQAESLLELTGIYDQLRSHLVMASRRAELTLPLSMAAALTLVVGATLSLLWHSRIL